MSSLKHNTARFFYSGFYSGFFPVAPGTAGTLVGMAVYVLIYCFFGQWVRWINVFLVIIIIYPSFKLGDFAESDQGTKDPQVVVLDEMLGYWMSVMFLPFSWFAVFTGFFFFRIFDIVKPFPANSLQKIPGGPGIMLDDMAAGLYTLAILTGIYMVMGRFPHLPIL